MLGTATSEYRSLQYFKNTSYDKIEPQKAIKEIEGLER